MTLLQAVTVFNTLSISLVLLTAIAARVRFGKVLFGIWIWAHLWELVATGADIAGKTWGYGPVVVLVIAASVWLSLWYVVQTGLVLKGRPWGYRWMAGVLAALLAYTSVCLILGWSYVPALAPIMIGIPIALGWLGVQFLRHERGDWRLRALWLGFPLLGRAALGLVMPFVMTRPEEWIFLGISALLHTMTGIGMVMFLADDTLARLDEKNAELEAKHAELQALDRLKDEFLATMSHELRTPLTAIKGGVELLAMSELSAAEWRRFLDSIHGHTVQLERLIGDVLDFSRLRTGEMKYEMEDEDLGRVVMETVESEEEPFTAAGLTLELVLDDDPVMVRHDYGRLRQVLLNLLSNARKFTPSGGTVTVRLETHDGAARLEVSDTGIGIAPELQERVFTQFYQVDSSSTRAYGGAGLGLAICRAIVEQGHGGRLTLESRSGGGSTFVVTLPLIPAPVREGVPR